MSRDCLKLTTYFGERDRQDGGFLADALLDLYERHRLATSLLLRGVEGFGVRHHMQTSRLLTLSEDLPLVTVAVDERARIEALVPEAVALFGDGLVTLERARILDAGDRDGIEHDTVKLTVYCGRREPFTRVVEVLHRNGVAGATVLLGVDGTAHGNRERARFFGRNANVPLMIVSVGERERIAAAIPELEALLARPLLTVERVQVLRRDGRRVEQPRPIAAADASGLPLWRKLMVYTSERSDLHERLIHGLRAAGASGATALRGIWGYHGDHAPHGDRLLALRRHVPVVTVIVDEPERFGRWLPIVEEVTAHEGLVTSELVPAARATGPEILRGTLDLGLPPG